MWGIRVQLDGPMIWKQCRSFSMVVLIGDGGVRVKTAHNKERERERETWWVRPKDVCLLDMKGWGIYNPLIVAGK